MSKEKVVRVVQVGEPFDIDLEAMPGAGYMWELASAEGEIELLSQEVVAISKAIGGSSTQRFQLVAINPGEGRLAFALKRKWEQKAVESREYIIRVE